MNAPICTLFIGALLAATASCTDAAGDPDGGDAGGDAAAGGSEAAAGGSDSAVGGGEPSPTCDQADPEPGLVNVEQGPVRGYLDGGTYAFQGIPYAAPPVGDLRFRPPQEPGCYDAPLEAMAFGPSCAQGGTDDDGEVIVVGEEDCLTLNVWAPEGAEDLPVLFFIHGGGNASGGAAQEQLGVEMYNGRNLAKANDVVVVTINYRLGLFGYLAEDSLAAESDQGVSGNYGILDQLGALEWVRRNIEGFGGDPDRVTVFGESGGGVDVCVLLASPLAEGLFDGAIIQSAACVASTKEEIDAVSKDAIAALSCDEASDVGGCLREKSVEEMITMFPVGPGVPAQSSGRPETQAHVDGYVLPAAPDETIAAGNHNRVPTIVGVNADENGLGVPQMDQAAFDAAVLAFAGGNQNLASLVKQQYPIEEYGSYRNAYVQMTSDATFVCPSGRAADLLAANQTEPVYRYHFRRAFLNGSSAYATPGAFHGIELFFIFNHLDPIGYTAAPEEQDLADATGAYWADFARGQLAMSSPIAWPTYTTDDKAYLVLDAPITTETGGINSSKCAFWASLAP